jgi:hypothetical protein
MKSFFWAFCFLFFIVLQACGDRQFSVKDTLQSSTGIAKKAVEPESKEASAPAAPIKIDEKIKDLSFEILGQKLNVRFIELKKASQADKTVVTTKIQLNNETISLVTSHDQSHAWTTRDIHSESVPFTLHVSALCELNGCERYLMVVMLLKDEEAGNTEAFREFGMVYSDKTKAAVLVLNKKSPEDLGTTELMELLRRHSLK